MLKASELEDPLLHIHVCVRIPIHKHNHIPHTHTHIQTQIRTQTCTHVIFFAIQSVYRKAIKDKNLGQNDETKEKHSKALKTYDIGANASFSNSQNRWRVHLHSEVTASAQTHNIGAEQCEGELTPQPGRPAAARITGLG